MSAILFVCHFVYHPTFAKISTPMKLTIKLRISSNQSLAMFLVTWSLMAQAAYSPGDPNAVYAQMGSIFDSNVFRVEGLQQVPSSYHAGKLSDLITVATLGGQYQQDLGRQSLQLGGSYNQNSYANYSGLNYKSWDLSSDFNWQMTSLLSGALHYYDKQEEPTLNLSNQVGRDVIRTQTAGMDFSWVPVSSWEFDTGFQHTDMRHQVQNTLDFNQNLISGAVWYATPKGSRFGLLIEDSDITYPSYLSGGQQYAYRQTDSKLQFEWPATAKLMLKAMVGQSAVKFKQDVNPGRTHNLQDLSAVWSVDSKSKFTVGYQSAPVAPGLSTEDVMNKSLYFLYNTKLSDKLSIDSAVRESTLHYLSSGVQVKTRSYRAALQWAPWRMWKIETYAQLISRKSGFTEDSYDINQLGINFRYSF